MPILLRLSLAALAASSAVSAAPARDTWQAEAAISSSSECSGYSYAPVEAIKGTYPSIGATASLSFSGVLAADKAAYAKISGSIPKIAPRGSPSDSTKGVKYSDSDPYCWWTWSNCVKPKLAGLPNDVTTCPEPHTWGLTLDDGPSCSHNAYYDFLKSINQKATVFYIGNNVMSYPLEAQRALGDGHEICLHTWSHKYMTALSNEEAFAELYYAQKAIKDVVGVTVECWRPPYGDVDDRIRWIAHALGLRTVIWDNDTNDWDYASEGVSGVERNYNAIINGNYAKHGTIVLSHEIDDETMALSKQFLPTIQKKFTVTPVGVCQNWTTPYAEGAAYQYPNFAQWQAGTRSIQLAQPSARGQGSVATSAAATTTKASAAKTTTTKKTTTTTTKTSTKKTTTTKKKTTTTTKKSTKKAVATKAKSGRWA